ncbi:hypothetical protein A3K80_04980 [Candidatus Bathyarchaeota archaeon RBG_13_38_9]|nr:MAG: hypothetical protein A3K80_04980 [Candidatus Bathyarchaeota archaeon RBG_13_38_9]
MDRFKNAQDLFADYEKSGNFGKLRKSLNILNELIEESNASAVNLKRLIYGRIRSQINDMIKRHNIPSFGNGLSTEELTRLIENSMTEEATNKILALYEIQSNYFDDGCT